MTTQRGRSETNVDRMVCDLYLYILLQNGNVVIVESVQENIQIKITKVKIELVSVMMIRCTPTEVPKMY